MDNQKPKVPSTKKYFLEPDTVYGNFKTIKEVVIRTNKGNESRWECVYLPKNEIRYVPAARLVYGSKLKDTTLNQEYLDELVNKDLHQQGIRNYLYRYYKTNACKRNHEFNLTKEEFISIIRKPCFYCGCGPYPTSDKLKRERGSVREPDFYYTGIDRIDSNGAYDVSNCVPCCSTCNYMKRTSAQAEFYNQIVRIYNHLNLGSTTIESITRDGEEVSRVHCKPMTVEMEGTLTDLAEGEDIV